MKNVSAGGGTKKEKKEKENDVKIERAVPTIKTPLCSLCYLRNR